jgi:hypothetical protein
MRPSRTALRSRGRLIARKCKQASHSNQVVVRQWASKRRHVVDQVFGGGLAGKFFVRPLGGSLGESLRVEWAIPAISLTKHCLSALGVPSFNPNPRAIGGIAQEAQDSLHGDLSRFWDGRHRVYEHARMPTLAGVTPSAMSTSICRQTGLPCKTQRSLSHRLCGLVLLPNSSVAAPDGGFANYSFFFSVSKVFTLSAVSEGTQTEVHVFELGLLGYTILR